MFYAHFGETEKIEKESLVAWNFKLKPSWRENIDTECSKKILYAAICNYK